jgi:hypothetical protein
MGAGEDFLTATPRMCGQRSMTGVRWAGPALYGEYLVALHGNMVDARTRRLIFADSAASLKVTAPTRAPAVSTDLPIALLTTSQATRSARCVATARSHI